ncbi:MAG: TMEM165/GDT1 family protein [Blastocatellia bacterium]
MDLKVLLTTFGMIFLAEMGDKTQLAAITMAAQTRKPVAVFIGASLALAAVSLIGVALGSVLAHYINAEHLRKAAAIAFIVIGALMLWGKM